MKRAAAALLVLLAACNDDGPAPEEPPPVAERYGPVKAYMGEMLEVMRAFNEVMEGEPTDEELAAAMDATSAKLVELAAWGGKVLREFPELKEDPPPAELVELLAANQRAGVVFARSLERAMRTAEASPEGSALRDAAERLGTAQRGQGRR
ncbi:MAG: hypothetical protein ACYS99_09590 [Planctomycetota bacterium]|jgi:hypothetical protein